MSTAGDAVRGTTVSERTPFRINLRLIPRIETYPLVLNFAQTFPGKVVILGLFGIGLWYRVDHWRPLILALAIMTALPQHRRLLLTAGSLLWACGLWWRWTANPRLLQAALVFILAAIMFWSARRFRTSWFGRRPVASLLMGFALTVFLASYLPAGGELRAAAWNFLTVAAAYLWFIAYSLLDATSKSSDPFLLQAGTYRPFWGSTSTPFVKGAAYLRRIEAQNAEQLAVAQLKGLKLFLWSVILDLFINKIFVPVVHGPMGIPFSADLFKLSMQRAPFPWYLGWASLILHFLVTIAWFAISGHRIVASCRMAGFLALRNTYRPLTSHTIAEFWNRYQYYFKELLVECFFYPTFMRYFKGSHRLRLFAATFAAAGFGNVFYHFFRDLHFIEDLGFWKALAGFQTYIFYAIILSVGISISQVRKRKVASNWFRGRLVPALCVCSFFCVLSVFDDQMGTRYPIQESFRFLGHLFNLVR